MAKQARAKRKTANSTAEPVQKLETKRSTTKRKKGGPEDEANGQSHPKRTQQQRTALKQPEKKQSANKTQDSKPQKRQKKQKQQKDDVEEPQQPQDPGRSVHDIFMEEVHAKEEELSKHCLIMGQVETEEDETTLEDLRKLTKVFVPEAVQECFVELWEQLDEVGRTEDEDDEMEEDEQGEGEEGDGNADDQDEQPDILGIIMKALLGGKMLQTRHASQMQHLFQAQLDSIDVSIRSKAWQDAFCSWAALLMAAHREQHWYEDTDEPEVVEAIYKRMRQQWLKLKARSDEELGGLVACGGSKSASEEFDAYLQALADDMKSMDYDVKDVVK